MTLQQKALEIAITQIGQEEKPRGSNWGEPVKTYLASVGINFPASWCMAFVYYCFDEAAHDLELSRPMIKSGGVLYCWQHSDMKYKIVDNPQPGDVFIQDHGHGLGHTGIVEKIEGDILHTVEGNTNIDGSREGFAVERKIRNKTDKKIIGYLRYI